MPSQLAGAAATYAIPDEHKAVSFGTGGGVWDRCEVLGSLAFVEEAYGNMGGDWSNSDL